MNATDLEDTLPRRIVDRLAARDRAADVATPRVDAAIARDAALHFAGRDTPYAALDNDDRSSVSPRTAWPLAPRRRFAATPRRWAAVAAAAALVAVLAGVFVRTGDFGRDAVLVADDIDRSGRVDILDAFALARLRAANSASASQTAIDALAARVVSLDESRRTL